MSYAVRKDGLGWRSVNSEGDILDTELFSETEPVLAPTEDQIRLAKFKEFNLIWDNLKIGYSPVSKTCFRVKYGSELGEGYVQSSLYNVDSLEIAVGNVYACNEQRMTDLANQRNILTVLETDTWIEPWGSFETNMVEITSVMLKAGEIKKEVYHQIFGV